MNRSLAPLLAAVAVANAHPAAACPAKGTGTLDQIVTDWVNKNQPGVAFGLCAVALDSKGHEGFACSGKAAAGVGLTKDTLFQIGSLTKTITATLLARRVVEGSYALGDKLESHLLPPFRVGTTNDPITILQLATHHSGLPRTPPSYLGEIGDFFQLDDLLITGFLSSGYLYSNWAFQILGYTMALEDGKSWMDDIADDVLADLDMSATANYETWTGDIGNLIFFAQHAASKHSSDGDDLGTGPASSCPTADPSGCLYASSHDMRIWLQYAMGLVTPSGPLADARHQLRRNFNDGDGPGIRQGLAWAFDQNDSDACDSLPQPTSTQAHYTRVEKSGDVDGSHAWIAFLQDPSHPDAVAPLGIIVMANSDLAQGKKLGDLGQDLLARLPLP